MTKKSLFLGLPIILSFGMLTACAKARVNQGPELRGISDITCLVDTKVDLLDGVTALDIEDGDITPALQIKIIPEVAVVDGYATFTSVGEYEVCYEVKDSEGKMARMTSFISVNDRTTYKDNLLINGFDLIIAGQVSVISNGYTNNKFTFNVKGSQIAEDIRLARTYTLKNKTEYTFKYNYKSNLGGNITIVADDVPFTHSKIYSGEHTLEFTYLVGENDNDKEDEAVENVKIELLLGAISNGDFNFTLNGVQSEHMQIATDYKEIAKNFKFKNDNIINRDNKAEVSVKASDDGLAATVQITKASDAIWKLGMFVNVGVQVEEGVDYLVSFDMERNLDNEYEVCIQHDQWNDSDAEILKKPQGHVEHAFKARQGFNGTLWLFIRSGRAENKITISNFSVKEKREGIKIEDYSIKEFGKKGVDNLVVENNKINFDILSFGGGSGDNELATPEFSLSGDSSTYVITFKAKADRKLSFILVGTLSERWETFLWKKLQLTTDTQTFAIKCDKKNLNGMYKILW